MYIYHAFAISHNPYFNRWFSAIEIKLADTYPCITVTILILIDGFLQLDLNLNTKKYGWSVTILILIDGFLQLRYTTSIVLFNWSHNPYFNRWFSAI